MGCVVCYPIGVCSRNDMKKSKDLFSQFILKVGRTPDKARQHRCQVDETKTWRTNNVWCTSFVENTSRPNPLCPQRQKISVNLGNLWLKLNQSKQLNYAKRTQFKTKSNFYNGSINNGLQRKNEIGHLVKTNPNKAKFMVRLFDISAASQVRSAYLPAKGLRI